MYYGIAKRRICRVLRIEKAFTAFLKQYVQHICADTASGGMFVKQDTACIHGVKLEIVSKPAFEAVGYNRPVGLGDGSIARFLAGLTESGKLQKLEETLCTPQQIWVCLSDCQSCGRGCAGTPICCRVCVEKTGAHDFSGFAKGELYTFPVPASPRRKTFCPDFMSSKACCCSAFNSMAHSFSRMRSVHSLAHVMLHAYYFLSAASYILCGE